MLEMCGRPYRLIVADLKQAVEASEGPICVGSDHAREVLDQIVNQIVEQRKKMNLEQNFSVIMWQMPIELNPS